MSRPPTHDAVVAYDPRASRIDIAVYKRGQLVPTVLAGAAGVTPATALIRAVAALQLIEWQVIGAWRQTDGGWWAPVAYGPDEEAASR